MIEVSHLSKAYGGHLAIDDLSFTVEDGQIYGLLGPNGAGKSTIMNILTSYLAPTSGEVTVAGFRLPEQAQQAKARVGYLPEQPPLYPEMTVAEYLDFAAQLKGTPKAQRKQQVLTAAHRTGLEQVLPRLIRTLSKGYRQRVGIAQALLGEPKVIILDEPTVGLDPLQIIEIRQLIRDLGERHTVILSSHILSEVQALCQQVLILSRGKLVAFDTPEALEKRMRAEQSALFRVRTDRETAEAVLASVPGLAGWDLQPAEDGVLTGELRFREGAESEAVCGALTLAFAAKGVPVLELRRRKASLEDVFLELTEQTAAPEDGGAERTPETEEDEA